MAWNRAEDTEDLMLDVVICSVCRSVKRLRVINVQQLQQSFRTPRLLTKS